MYQRLDDGNIKTILGLNVPQLIGWDAQLLAIEMTIVIRPFLLDFAGACVDIEPVFPENVWQEWEEEGREQFGEHWNKVLNILTVLRALGIYLLDINPRNISFLEEPR